MFCCNLRGGFEEKDETLGNTHDEDAQDYNLQTPDRLHPLRRTTQLLIPFPVAFTFP